MRERAWPSRELRHSRAAGWVEMFQGEAKETRSWITKGFPSHFLHCIPRAATPWRGFTLELGPLNFAPLAAGWRASERAWTVAEQPVDPGDRWLWQGGKQHRRWEELHGAEPGCSQFYLMASVVLKPNQTGISAGSLPSLMTRVNVLTQVPPFPVSIPLLEELAAVKLCKVSVLCLAPWHQYKWQ